MTRAPAAGHAGAVSPNASLAVALAAIDAAADRAALDAACTALDRLARRGSVEAALVLGRVLWALPERAAEGAGWLAAAAEAGSVEALHRLGLAFHHGRGVARDRAMAARLGAAAAALDRLDQATAPRPADPLAALRLSLAVPTR